MKNFDINTNLDITNTPATFIFPSRHGRGLFSHALVSFLVETQNSLVGSNANSMAPHLATEAHMAAMSNDQLQSLLLANTRHSLKAGGVREEEFDIVAMERQLRER